MKLTDVKERIDKFFNEISDEDLFDLLVEEYGFPVEYIEVGEYEVSHSCQKIKGGKYSASWSAESSTDLNTFTLAA
ncbi:hypothetical protein [uncultured Porphyromonas sp.]|jgi:hypothetical protein|uniref:hypothetical protein n=1 Tax=uncultured Porphyromonas sp. TaxID=159274 RepID=UPI002628A50C|nr:hypothetical protein [uncultured Porphyromonas sp.]